MTRISRYQGLQIRERVAEGGRPVRYLARRFLPQPRASADPEIAGERLDNLAARLLGDPTLYWQICDETRVLNPAELEQPPSALPRVVGALKALPQAGQALHEPESE